jgi:hypothetical protein
VQGEIKDVRRQQVAIIGALRHMARSQGDGSREEWGALVRKLADALQQGPSPTARYYYMLEEAMAREREGQPLTGKMCDYFWRLGMTPSEYAEYIGVNGRSVLCDDSQGR